MTPTMIVIHHSLTKDSRTVSWNAIKRYHTKTLGWRDIGYHYGFENVEGQIAMFKGRENTIQGAHVRGFNVCAIGICCVGNYDLRQPPSEMISMCVELVQHLQRRFDIDTHDVFGHHELNPDKTCPGVMFDMDHFRNLLNEEES